MVKRVEKSFHKCHLCTQIKQFPNYYIEMTILSLTSTSICSLFQRDDVGELLAEPAGIRAIGRLRRAAG